tara:strand:+ start:28075 stop:28509 length:435 start_codon:yes stop_codon:yes gene_type:complete
VSKIELPENYIFSNKLDVRIDDINYGNHLDFSRLVSMLSNTRALFFKENNYPELSEDNIGIITKDVRVSFLDQAFFGNNLRFLMGVTCLKRASFVLGFLVQAGDSQPKDIAHGEITLAFIDYSSQRPRAIPKDFISMIDRCKYI